METSMSEELEQLLKNLKLRRMLEIYEEQLRAAEKQDVSYSEFLTRLLRAQWHHRQEAALEYRIRSAKLPERWSLETFPFDRQPGSEPQTDPHLCRTGLPRQGRKYRVHRSHCRGQNRISFWPCHESPGE
jgi:DNA replication protein DnaC